jgi:alpha-D-ribose 1-methylphosphonate 5-triphosphate diphosphatase
MNDATPILDALTIAGGEVLLDGEGLVRRDITLRDGRIAFDTGRSGAVLDAHGLLVLPGIVDIHGDAFERQLQPRPGVDFPIDVALADTERQLLANGITTAFHGITLSWEPGLRSVATWSALLDALDAARPHATCDMRVHLRWEAFNLDALEVALADIAAGRVHLLGLNDHTPGIVRKLSDPAAVIKFSGRGPLSPEAFAEVARGVAARAAEVPAGVARIAAAARAAGLPIASHDDATVAERAAARALGAHICEFPMAEDVGLAARDAGEFVVMGAPNVLRGGSHLGWASAARLAEAGICRVLATDYYYPAMLQAAFALAGRGVLTLAQAWALVAANPAAAAGLDDRGRIAAGLRGDLLLVAPGPRPRLVATVCGGRLAWLAADGADRRVGPTDGERAPAAASDAARRP